MKAEIQKSKYATFTDALEKVSINRKPKFVSDPTKSATKSDSPPVDEVIDSEFSLDSIINERPTSISIDPTYYTKKKKHANYQEVDIDRIFAPSWDENEYSKAISQSDVEEFECLRESLRIMRSSETTLVFAIVIDKENDNENGIHAIKCNGGTAFGGYAYDGGRDSYIVRGIDFFQIGRIPHSYVITMPNLGAWQVKVPIPEALLEKHLSPQQRDAMGKFMEKWPTSRYEIQLIQMLGCN